MTFLILFSGYLNDHLNDVIKEVWFRSEGAKKLSWFRFISRKSTRKSLKKNVKETHGKDLNRVEISNLTVHCSNPNWSALENKCQKKKSINFLIKSSWKLKWFTSKNSYACCFCNKNFRLQFKRALEKRILLVIKICGTWNDSCWRKTLCSRNIVLMTW